MKLLHGSRALVTRAFEGARRRVAPRRSTIVVAAEPEEALLASATALRALGAKITRYDAAAGSLEARGVSVDARAVLSLRATADDARATRLRLKTDARDSRALFRRFREALTGAGRTPA